MTEKAAAALQAVLSLHTNKENYCRECNAWFPCATIQAIENSLRVEKKQSAWD